MNIRCFALSSVLALSVACTSQPAPAPQSQGAAPAGGAPAVGAPASAASAAPAAPAAPMMMEMTVPSGTALELTLETPVALNTSKVEDAVSAKVAKAVVVDGMTVIPAGALATGTVVEANQSGRVTGRASVTIRFNRVTVANTPYTIQTARIVREAEGAGAIIGSGAAVKTTISDPVKINAPM
jgi:hypothetical protein